MELTNELIMKLPEALEALPNCNDKSCNTCPANLFRTFAYDGYGSCDDGVHEAARIFIQNWLDSVLENGKEK